MNFTTWHKYFPTPISSVLFSFLLNTHFMSLKAYICVLCLSIIISYWAVVPCLLIMVWDDNKIIFIFSRKLSERFLLSDIEQMMRERERKRVTGTGERIFFQLGAFWEWKFSSRNFHDFFTFYAKKRKLERRQYHDWIKISLVRAV